MNKKVLILFNTMGKMNKISTFICNLLGIKLSICHDEKWAYRLFTVS